MNGEYLDKWTNHDEEDENKPREKEQKDILVSRDSLLLLICVHDNVNWFQAAQKPEFTVDLANLLWFQVP